MKFNVSEQKKIQSIEAAVDGNGNTVLEGRVTKPGVFGSLSTLNGSVAISQGTFNANVEWTTPRGFFGLPASIKLMDERENFKSYSSYSLNQRALILSTFPIKQKRGKHASLSAEVALEDLMPSLRNDSSSTWASPEILSSRLRTTKYALKWNYRRNESFSTEEIPYIHGGKTSQSTAELAFSGDVAFAKASLSRGRFGMFKLNAFPSLPIIWSLRQFAGVIAPLDKDKTPIQDRFFTGGVLHPFTSFHGSKFRRAGATCERGVAENAKNIDRLDGTGNDGVALSNLTVGIPYGVCMPFFFADAGIFMKTLSLPRKNFEKDLINSAKFASGFGVSLPVEVNGLTAHVEASYTIFTNQKKDAQEKFQFAVKINL